MSNLEKLRNAADANPVLLLFLGACPAMGASYDLRAALALGLTVLAISLICSVIITALKRFLSDCALLWASVIVSAGLASAAQLLIEAFAPALYSAVSLYTAVCAVNLMIFSRADAGFKAGMKSGLLFLAAILPTALIREFVGNGSIWGISISAAAKYKIPLLAGAPGGFLVFSFVLAIINAALLHSRKEGR